MKTFMISVVALLTSVLIPAAVSAAASPTVVISEVAWAGSSKGTADEWLELTNASETAVDLSGFTLEGAGTSGTALTIPAGTVIEPHQAFLISNYAADDAKSVLASSDLVTTAVSLSNSALGITLKDPTGTVLDRAGDGKAPRTGSSAAPFASMRRLDPANDGTLASSWATASASNGFDEGLNDLGTPGNVDFIFAPPPEPEPEELPAPIAEEPAPPVEEPTTEPVVEPEPTAVPAEIPPEAVEPMPSVEVELVAEPTVEAPVEEPVAHIETASEPVAVVTPPGTLVVNELYPSPATGEDEWVEIYNPFNNVIPLGGWRVRDGSGKLTPLPDQLLGFGQFVLVANPAGKLNNGGDAVALLDASGAVIDEIAYGTAAHAAPKSTQALARGDDGAFAVTTTPTPGEANRITAPVAAKKSVKTTATPVQTETTSSPESYEPPPATVVAPAAAVSAAPIVQAVARPAPAAAPVFFVKPVPVPKPAATPKPAAVSRAASIARVTLAAVQDLASGKKVAVTAVVTAAPGPLGAGTIAIADATGGLLVERSGGSLPALKVGDRLAVSGTVRVSHGVRRIVLAASSGLTVLSHGEGVSASAMAIEDLDDGDVGGLITVKGEVAEQRGALLKISADGSLLSVRLAEGDEQPIAKGAEVTATGILTSTGTELRLQLRSAEDLAVESLPAPAATAKPIATQASHSGIKLVLASLVVLAALAAKHFIPLIKTRYASTRPLRLASQETD